MTDTTAPRTAAQKEWVNIAKVAGMPRCPMCATTFEVAEAIEPLLALVRAAQDYLVIEDETSPVEVTDFEAWWRDYEARVAGAVAATRDALAALPESIRAKQ